MIENNNPQNINPTIKKTPNIILSDFSIQIKHRIYF
jgi:hypothetical protein